MLVTIHWEDAMLEIVELLFAISVGIAVWTAHPIAIGSAVFVGTILVECLIIFAKKPN
jgi:hypothetical protein